MNKKTFLMAGAAVCFITAALTPLLPIDYSREPAMSHVSSNTLLTRYGSPVTNVRICSTNGWRMHPIYHEKRWHYGVDFCGSMNDGIFAAAAGKIEHYTRSSGYGNAIFLHHDDGSMTIYAHLNKFSTLDGVRVRKGQLIGRMGTSGNAQTPHLHFELLKGDQVWVHYNDVNAFARQLRQRYQAGEELVETSVHPSGCSAP